MTTFTVDPTKNAASLASPYCRLSDTEVDVSPPVRELYTSIRYRLTLTDEVLERLAFMRLSEDSFAEDWDSPEDAIYDTL